VAPLERLPQRRHHCLATGALLRGQPIARVARRLVLGADARQLAGIDVRPDPGDLRGARQHLRKLRPGVEALERRHELERVSLAHGRSSRAGVVDPHAGIAVDLARGPPLPALAARTLAQLNRAPTARVRRIGRENSLAGEPRAHRVGVDPVDLRAHDRAPPVFQRRAAVRRVPRRGPPDLARDA
jgi:hypothetical protein